MALKKNSLFDLRQIWNTNLPSMVEQTVTNVEVFLRGCGGVSQNNCHQDTFLEGDPKDLMLFLLSLAC